LELSALASSASYPARTSAYLRSRFVG